MVSNTTIEINSKYDQTLINFVSIFQLELTHSATSPKRSEGFSIKNVVMVLQPHNSKFTIELLQDLPTIITQ